MTTTKGRMSPAELKEACYRAAGTAAVGYVLGFIYEDAAVNNDGFGWPTMASEVDLGPANEGDLFKFGTLKARVSEAGHLAALKHRGLGSHGLCLDGELTDTRGVLDDAKVWSAIEALAAFIEGNDDGDGYYSALGVNTDEKGEEGGGLKVLKAAGLTPTYWADVGRAAWRERCERCKGRADEILAMTDDELSRMPWTRELMAPEELKDWVATRPAAGLAIDIETCGLGCWAAYDADPYGVRGDDLSDEMKQVGTNRWVRSPESRGWVHEGDLPSQKAAAMYDRITREYALWEAAVERHAGWRPNGRNPIKVDPDAPDWRGLIAWFRSSFPDEARAIEARVVAGRNEGFSA